MAIFMANNIETKIFIPFLGGFSSGKSSLINSLLGDEILSTDITPETALPVILTYAQLKRFESFTPEKDSRVLALNSLAEGDFTSLAERGGWLEVHHPALKPFKSAALVDLPGWSSGQNSHELQLDNYLLRLSQENLDSNIVYIIAIAADEGTLKDNILSQIAKIELGNSSYIVAITKSDKRNASDLDSIKNHVTELVAGVLGRDPFAVVQTSSRKQLVADLQRALSDYLEKVSVKNTAPDTKDLLGKIKNHLSALREYKGEVRHFADDVFDDLWDSLIDTLLDSHFESVNYNYAKSIGQALVDDLLAIYRAIFLKYLHKYNKNTSDEFANEIKSAGIASPESDFTFTDLEWLKKQFRNYIQIAIDKSKPGLLSSSDPDAVGQRICEKISAMRSEFQKSVVGFSARKYNDHFSNQIESWQRVEILLG